MELIALLGLVLALIQGYLITKILIRREGIFYRLMISLCLAISLAVIIGVLIASFGVFSLNTLVIAFIFSNIILLLVLFIRKFLI